LGYRGLPKRMFGTFNKLKGELNIFRRLPKLEERPRTIPTAPPMFDRGNNPDNEEISNEEIRGEHWEYIPPHNTGWEMDKGFYNEQASEGRMRFELDSDDEETELDRSIEQELSEIPGGYGSDKGVLQEDPGMLAPHKVYPHFENNEADGSKDEFVPPGHRPQQEEEYMPPGMAVETETAETEGMNPSEHGPKQYEPRRAGDMNKKDFKDRDLNDKMYAEQQAVSDFKPLKRLPSIKTTVTLAIFVIVSFVLGFIVRGFFVG
ncbi:hypothetical protein JW868_02600, partial [Candidatus Woesearchaeota archaeon]|nr:hypothetical protein [Candidatus Woesearchaeota archaeon]